MVKILNANSSYPTVVLISVEMNCSSITEDEFIDTIKKCLVEANKEYKELVVPKYKEFITEQYINNLEFSLKRAKTYAESKWKTEKRRNQYIEEVKTNVKKDYDNRLSKLENISIDFFDFQGPYQSSYRPEQGSRKGECSPELWGHLFSQGSDRFPLS